MSNKTKLEVSLEILLLLMTVTFIVATIKSQDMGELIFNYIYLVLAITYYIIRLLPDSEVKNENRH